MTDELRPPPMPEEITREQVVTAVEALGLDPTLLRCLEVRSNRIRVDTWLYDFSRTPPSRKFDETGDNFIKYSVSIPIVEALEGEK